MKQQQVYNLEEFAAKYHLNDIFGAYAAHFSIMGDENGSISMEVNDELSFWNMVKERTLFSKVLLVKAGHIQMKIGDKDIKVAEQDLLLVPSQEIVSINHSAPNFEAECILVDEKIVQEVSLYHLSEDKNKSVLDVFHFVCNIVRHQHINKIEMIKSMFNVLKLIIDELPYEQCTVTRDIKHKKEVYEIFLHHLYCNFHKERQIRFYANKLNVSTAYLSRLVKDISGSTVNEHVTSLLYKEICNLLKQTSMSMGEIADELHFSDQSALSNFFKQRSGMTPLAYRNK